MNGRAASIIYETRVARRNISVEELKQLQDTDGVKLAPANIALIIWIQGFVLLSTKP